MHFILYQVHLSYLKLKVLKLGCRKKKNAGMGRPWYVMLKKNKGWSSCSVDPLGQRSL